MYQPQERGPRSDSRGPFFYDYIGVLKKVDFFSGLAFPVSKRKKRPLVIPSMFMVKLLLQNNSQRIHINDYLIY